MHELKVKFKFSTQKFRFKVTQISKNEIPIIEMDNIMDINQSFFFISKIYDV